MIHLKSTLLAAALATALGTLPAAADPGHAYDGNMAHWALGHLAPFALLALAAAGVIVVRRRRMAAQRRRQTTRRDARH